MSQAQTPLNVIKRLVEDCYEDVKSRQERYDQHVVHAEIMGRLGQLALGPEILEYLVMQEVRRVDRSERKRGDNMQLSLLTGDPDQLDAVLALDDGERIKIRYGRGQEWDEWFDIQTRNKARQDAAHIRKEEIYTEIRPRLTDGKTTEDVV